MNFDKFIYSYSNATVHFFRSPIVPHRLGFDTAHVRPPVRVSFAIASCRLLKSLDLAPFRDAITYGFIVPGREMLDGGDELTFWAFVVLGLDFHLTDSVGGVGYMDKICHGIIDAVSRVT